MTSSVAFLYFLFLLRITVIVFQIRGRNNEGFIVLPLDRSALCSLSEKRMSRRKTHTEPPGVDQETGLESVPNNPPRAV